MRSDLAIWTIALLDAFGHQRLCCSLQNPFGIRASLLQVNLSRIPLIKLVVIRIILVQICSLPDRSIREGDFADFTELSLGNIALVWMAYFIWILLVWTPESLAKASEANEPAHTVLSPPLQQLT